MIQSNLNSSVCFTEMLPATQKQNVYLDKYRIALWTFKAETNNNFKIKETCTTRRQANLKDILQRLRIHEEMKSMVKEEQLERTIRSHLFFFFTLQKQ